MQYHMVFFASWLSHVPPQELDRFLQKVARAVCPGGYVALVDQYAPTVDDRQVMREGDGGNIYAQRQLRDGQTYNIVKVFYNVKALHEKFTALGFDVAVYRLNDIFFLLEARLR